MEKLTRWFTAANQWVAGLTRGLAVPAFAGNEVETRTRVSTSWTRGSR